MTTAELATVHNTSVLEHSYPQPPAGVYAAFALPARKRRRRFTMQGGWSFTGPSSGR